MSVTYNPSLPKEMDWVRFHVGDTAYDSVTQSIDPEQAFLQDEEIIAILAEEPNKWFAAARAAMLILAQDTGSIIKRVGDLHIESGEDPENAYRKHIDYLRSEGARLLLDDTPIFRIM